MLAKSVSEAHEEEGIPERRLAAEERDAVRRRLRDNLGVDFKEHRWPWDSEDAPHGIRDEKGWSLIPLFVGDAPCLMIVNDIDCVWCFESVDDAIAIMGDWGHDFYIFDEAATYVICHNHHDYLIAWGAAQPWLEAIGSQGVTRH